MDCLPVVLVHGPGFPDCTKIVEEHDHYSSYLNITYQKSSPRPERKSSVLYWFLFTGGHCCFCKPSRFVLENNRGCSLVLHYVYDLAKFLNTIEYQINLKHN